MTKRWADRRRQRRRAKRPAPSGLPARELAALAGVTLRTIRYYVEQRLLPAPELRGKETRYSREHQLRVFAILAMQREGLRLAAIRKRLDGLGAAELERYAPPSAAAPPAAPEPVKASPAMAGPPPVAPLDAVPERTYAAERWERITLLPGLELFVRSDASSLVRHVAQQFHDHCVGVARG